MVHTNTRPGVYASILFPCPTPEASVSSSPYHDTVRYTFPQFCYHPPTLSSKCCGKKLVFTLLVSLPEQNLLLRGRAIDTVVERQRPFDNQLVQLAI